MLGAQFESQNPAVERYCIDPNQIATRNCSGSAVSSKRQKYRGQDLVIDDKKAGQGLPSYMDSGETRQAAG